jgi:hypothetical protein
MALSTENRLAMCLAPIAALVYPLTLMAFNAAVTAFETGHVPALAASIAAFALALSFILSALVSISPFAIWRAPSDRFQAFQLASGMYLAFYILGHMNSVFFYARVFLGIETDWGFATGAPAGLIKDPWNIRLVPHYALGVFFLLSHLSSGLRDVLMEHGLCRVIADRLMIGGSIAGGVVATLIILGMCGMRIRFT